MGLMVAMGKTDLLGNLLRDVSRSFYRTLRVLPLEVRAQISLAYLLARTADTIADSELLPQTKRLPRLLLFRKQFTHAIDPSEIKAIIQSGASQPEQKPDAERQLLVRLNESFDLFQSLEPGDRGRVADVVVSLTRAMELDLQRFSPQRSILSPRISAMGALNTFEDLEEYTYHAAGCVGPFWTRMCIARLPAFQKWNVEEMCALGIRFGKALQWTNVLRDAPRDLHRGRCYLPSRDLQSVGLIPADLQNPSSFARFRPVYQRYLDHALEHYRAAWRYTMAIPKSCPRARLACIFPIWIGLETVALLRHSKNPLDPARRIRISRSRVYAIMGLGVASVWSDHLLDAHCQKLFRNAESPSKMQT